MELYLPNPPSNVGRPRISFLPTLSLLALLWPLAAPASEAHPPPPERPAVAYSATDVPDGLNAADWQTLRDQIKAHAYTAAATDDGGYRAANPASGLTIDYHPDGTTRLTPHSTNGWDFGLTVSGIGPDSLNQPERLSSEEQTVTYHWSARVREWWVNGESGLEQWLELSQRPAGLAMGQPLTVQMTVSGSLHGVAAGNAVAFTDASGATVFTYDKLKVWDATGKVLPAQMNLSGQMLALVVDDATAVYPLTIDPTITVQQQAYLKASNTGEDRFGLSVAVSGDTVVVGAYQEDSNATGVNGNQGDNSATDAGAAYVFVRSGSTWTQQAYLKASNTEADDQFGWSVAVDGDTVVVGARYEASTATGVNGDQSDNLDRYAGAAYVFVRSGSTWSQQAYLKASNTETGDFFGWSVAVDGDTVVVGAYGEDSTATGVNGDRSNNSARNAGAAYVFVRSGSTWSQQAYLKASNTGVEDTFGWSVAVDGDTVVVGAHGEDSTATGVNGDGSNNSVFQAGAAYVFVRSGSTWSQQAYLKASNTAASNDFGYAVAVSGDTVVVGATRESSRGNESGAAYVFVRSGSTWSQQAYLKASPVGSYDYFGSSVALASDTVVVGASSEDSTATGVNGDGSNNSAFDAGAAYVFVRSGSTWSQQAYLKASNTGENDQFGWSVAVSGDTVVVGAHLEDSTAIGVNGNQGDNSAIQAGAGYVFSIAPSVPTIALNPTIPLLSAFSTAQGSASTAQSFEVGGVDLTGGISVSAPTGFEVSLSVSSGYNSSISLTPTGDMVLFTPVYVRLSAAAIAGDYAGNLSITSPGASSASVAVTGMVTAAVATPGDANNDGEINTADIQLIQAARNTPASGPDDPRDLDGDGRITVLDARRAVVLCTNPKCAPTAAP